jgi:integrase
MKTLDVLAEVLAGKRMSKSSKENCKAVFQSLSRIYEDFPGRPIDINKWLVGLEGYADQTVRLWFNILRSVSEFMENNYNLTNPCKGVEVPKVKKKRRRYFKADEIVRVLQACKSDIDTALIMTLVDSTCRIGGLAGLYGRDIGKGYINVVEKTGERRYRLDDRLCDVLYRLAGGDDNKVFGGISSSGLSMRVIRICKRAGMKGDKLGPHTFRHSSASIVAEETKNVMAVKALLQHDNIQTSMVYIHDVEEGIQQNISPLKLVAERVKDESLYKQKMLTEKAGGNGDANLVEDDEVDGLVDSMFPVVPVGISIRPLLKSEDLILIRKGFMEMVSNSRYRVDVGRARELMRRILRKVK